MKPDAIVLLGDEQYQVGKFSDFEASFEQAWGGLKFLARRATLVLNGHEHAYARFQPMDPTGAVDTEKGIPEIIVGTGGEGLDSLAKNADGTFANPNVVTGYGQGYGVLKLTLTQHGYEFSYAPALKGAGQPASALVANVLS